MENKRAQWSSNIGFILATVGSAVGLGNIWRFPYIMGKNGVAVFLLIYVLIIAFICAIPLCLELATGKIYRLDAVSSYEKINPKLAPFGYLCILTAILIPCFYFVVGGWILNYIWIFAANSIPSDFGAYFSSLNSNIFAPLGLTLVFLIMTAYFPYKGVNKGIEKANNIMMPLFAIMLITLAVYALFLPGAKAGLEFMFKPDFSVFNHKMILTALGQALFTLSIGMGTILTYGSYLDKKTNIKKSAYTLIFFDTLIAILAGIMIFPIVFSEGIEPSAGAILVFISLPEIFTFLPFSNICAIIFFLLLFFAAITSGISLMETSIACFVDKFKMKRSHATLLLSAIIAIMAIPASLSFGALSGFKIFNKTFFDLLDFLTSSVLLPFNTFIICIIGGWYAHNVSKEAFGETFFGKILLFILKFILPVILILALIFGLN
ncbi:MAG: sodium-dependent transporter [Candidatus Gastranaerophilales bacterium]|nr:sodium-dependent transporter [Candidatus Gastranaerophilales bacterium]